MSMSTHLSILRASTRQLPPEEFLGCFPNTFIQYFDDTPTKDASKACSIPRFNPRQAEEKQRVGCGVFFSPNPFKNARRTENLLGIRAVFVDIDCAKEGERTISDIDAAKNAALEALTRYEAPPHLAWETKNGLHAVWLLNLVSGEDAIRTFHACQDAIIRLFHADPVAKDVTRVLRIPGFLHLKNPAQPFRCTLLLDNLEKVPPYDLAPLLASFSAHVPANPAKRMAKAWREAMPGVGEGGRNAAAASVAGKLLVSLSEELWETAGWGGLKEWNASNEPPLDERELRSVFQSIAQRQRRTGTKKDGTPADKSTKQTDRVLALLTEDACTLFHSDLGEPFAHVLIDAHRETWEIGGSRFGRWLKGRYWKEYGEAVNDAAFASAFSIIEARASFDGQKIRLWNRVAWHDGTLYYDLCDAEWRAVRVTAEGWEIVEQPPILFRRFGHEQAQVLPIRGGNLQDILQFTNLPTEEQRVLFLIYLLSCFIPGIAHPILNVFGDQGATKSTHLRLIRRIVDPAKPLLLALPSSRAELEQQLSHHWLPFFDNVSYLSDEFSDAFCRASTGDGGSKRKLWTDSDDVRWEYQPCLALNGINVCARKPDLLDRSILLKLERMPKAKRRSEKKVWQEFDALLPSLLGGAFDALSHALRVHPSLEEEELPRMADFAQYGRAIAEGLGFTQGTFLNAFYANIEQQHQEAIDASEVATAVVCLMEQEQQGYWKGSPSQLLEALEGIAEEEKISMRSKLWPKAPQVLTKRINEAKTNLEEIGIRMEQGRDGTKRWIELRKIGQNTVTTDTASQVRSDGQKIGDGSDDRQSKAVAISAASWAEAQQQAENDSSDDTDGPAVTEQQTLFPR